ncbi:uncharacterized protein LOC113551834 [Rhopalosiphum maidis]|uniref:uncharacterized protein LOC113551834 n=1 Tax=Rhopalosiphum maidis TaxID=43146 RepID=UPI000F00E317|nr:uncharacterized protein LOC113551834 [Rhopalosiphum maidis]
MKTLFVLCTAVTVLQVFDVSITEISALRTNPTSPTPREAVDPGSGKPIVKPRAITKPNGTPESKPTNPEPANGEPGTNPNEEESSEVEPTTIKESGRRAVRTAKRIANRRGAGLLNSFTGLLKTANNTADFFGRFLRDRSKNVKDVAKESMGMVSSFSDRSTNGAKNLMKSARIIGNQGANTMYSTLQKSTSLGKNLVKLGGTVVGTPISIGEDVVSTGNSIAKIPSKVSRIVSEGAIKPLLNTFGPNSDEEEPEEEPEEENPPKTETPKAPTPAAPITRKPTINKKPT